MTLSVTKLLLVLGQLLSLVWLSGTQWTVARQTDLSMGFSWQEYWSWLPFPSPGDLPRPEIECASPAWTGGFFTWEAPQGSSPPETPDPARRTELPFLTFPASHFSTYDCPVLQSYMTAGSLEQERQIKYTFLREGAEGSGEWTRHPRKGVRERKHSTHLQRDEVRKCKHVCEQRWLSAWAERKQQSPTCWVCVERTGSQRGRRWCYKLTITWLQFYSLLPIYWGNWWKDSRQPSWARRLVNSQHVGVALLPRVGRL